MVLITITEDKEFLLDRRRPRIGYMSCGDISLAEKEGRNVKRQNRLNYLRIKDEKQKKADYWGYGI